MKEFYTALQNPQMSKSQALQAAQLNLINQDNQNSDFSHPYYWAVFSHFDFQKVQGFVVWKLKNLAFNSHAKEKSFLSNS